MPRVSAQHLADRRLQIVAAAVRCFARAGVHGTTMQDVFAEAGLSPGGVYRYFKSKDDLIVAIAEGVSRQLDALLGEPEPDVQPDVRTGGIGDEVRRIVAAFDSVETDEDHRRVAVAIWNESLHNPGVAGVVADIVERVTCSLASRLAHMQDDGRWRDDVDAHAAAQVIVALLPGYALQRIWFPNLDPQSFISAATTLLSPTESQAPRRRPPG